jgi:choice-of-anchor A domain-containing protein
MKAKTLTVSATIMVVLALGFSQRANATTNGLGVASDYNVFTLGNVTQSYTDIQGKVAAGGTINFSGSIGGSLPANSGNVVVAGGDLILSNGQVNNGNAIYGGTATIASNEGFPNGKATKGSYIDFNAATSSLQSLSSNLSSLTANGSTSIKYGGITLTGTDPQLEVFNLDGTQLSSANNFTINSQAGATVVVNISGTNVSLQNFGFSINGTNEQDILFNFYQATTLTASGIAIEGSILAPLANFSFNNGHVDGNVVVNSLTGNGESHNSLFQGNLPTFQTQPKKVPEPRNLIGLGLMAGIFGLSRNRKNKSIIGCW